MCSPTHNARPPRGTQNGRVSTAAQTPDAVKVLAFRVTSGAVVEVSRNTRLGDALGKLVDSGESGISPLDFPPGVRLSGLIFKLRQMGVAIGRRRYKVPSDPFGAIVATYLIVPGSLQPITA